MSIQKLGFRRWYSSLCEAEFETELAARKYEDEERMKWAANGPEAKFLESLTAEQAKYLAEKELRNADKGNWMHVQQDFVNANPGFLPNKTNGERLSTALVVLGLLDPVTNLFSGTMDDMQAVYADLAAKGMLQLREGAPLPEPPFDEKAAYEMDFAGLERKARGWSDSDE